MQTRFRVKKLKDSFMTQLLSLIQSAASTVLDLSAFFVPGAGF